MKGIATRVTAVVGAVALTTCLATPALASPGGHGRGQGTQGNHGPGTPGFMSENSGSQGIGIGRLSGLDLTWDQMTAVHRALVEARSTMQAAARTAAIAALLSAGTINAAQAKALADATGRSALQALLSSGTITWAQMKALKAAMRTAGATDRTAATLAALKSLAASGVITAAQVDLIMARLSMTGAAGQGQQSNLEQGSMVPGSGRGEGANHGHWGQHGHGALGGDDEGDDEGDDDDQGENEDEDEDEMSSRAAS